MTHGAPRVVLDANVLFPFSLRDTLLRLSAQGLYHVVWSSQILDETTRNLVATSRMSVHQADRLRAAMERAFPEACVDDDTDWLAAALNAPHDRHVVACALRAARSLHRHVQSARLRTTPSRPRGMSPRRLPLRRARRRTRSGA